ncbi:MULTISPECIES: DUF3422 family protein [Thiorhodovibrio]|uniref:DUF3422 family protein n=1 Tax=Thiorhodovibrio TaxID=61593 RepID=UPI0019114F96|nr:MULTISPECIES: DUF3422 domain-containing protein [Thiorhodovibrio]MBK5968945.1 hypothetical protein [Thiorhodovibrio winogradskyi]WPL10340.1 hypothetical protein Thiosp_00052 [Thiorhodovibrio litoralis]
MSVPFRDHPLRYALTEELHARTFEPLRAPARVAHLAVVCGERGSGRNDRHLKRLLEHFDAPVPERPGQYHYARLCNLQLRWERHTEFVTYSFASEEDVSDPFARNPLEDLPPDWLRELPGEVISSVLLVLEPRDAPERDNQGLVALFGGNPVMGSQVVGGAGLAYSDMRIHDDGHGRILLRDIALSEDQAGRLVKRVMEINAYRAMALLGLPLARRATALLSDADQRLTEVAKTIARSSAQRDAGARSSDAVAAKVPLERELLADLTALATEIESVAAQTTYRFEASSAYYRIVEQRLVQLRQQRIEGLQTLNEFLEARLAPAVATCVSTGERQQRLAERAGRLIGLLRARVEVSLQEQNRGLLDSMDRRARIQLRLQETVEGLSVIAISYYGAGLVGYLLKGLAETGYPVNATLGLAAAVPIIALLTWFALHRTKRHLRRQSESGMDGDSGKPG